MEIFEFITSCVARENQDPRWLARFLFGEIVNSPMLMKNLALTTSGFARCKIRKRHGLSIMARLSHQSFLLND